MCRACSIVVLSFLACSALAAAAQDSGQLLAVPCAETFTRPQLDAAWKVDVSAGDTITAKDGVLEIVADQNTYAHIERPMGVDFVRATCAIKGAPAITWCTSLFCC
jgi:hypothetical protein